MSTKIEWCDETWNPITGCSPISKGCQNCYAKLMANRLRGRFGYPQDDPFKPTYHSDRIGKPSKWKYRKIFVNSMGDLFHDDFMDKGIVSGEIIYRIYYEMSEHQDSIFLILTKRSQNALSFYNDWIKESDNIKNIWFGVTVESPEYLHRIDDLLEIPAAVRFVSIEPMLEPVVLNGDEGGQYYFSFENEQGTITPGIDWVIAGPETGPGARPCDPEWIENLYEQCKSAGVPFFDKRPNYLAREFPA